MEEIKFKFNGDGLICAVAQDVYTGEVLMQAYMNQEAIDKTLESGYAYYYSRSRQCLWKKGETSGHLQKVKKILYDCDCDCLLLQIEQIGAACHTGNRSCFYRTLKEFEFVPDYKVVFEDVETIR
ncbi:MAG: phosphoribosyl-AMP cyclohydrolase, partial [Clostridia bacterium]|nr:phosphoribosyl-AMP cyclohydrolase [Clostridia bacterium]